MSSRAINQLDAKTPLNTDLVPVADPVTGIAGKSNMYEVRFGADPNSTYPYTLSPVPSANSLERKYLEYIDAAGSFGTSTNTTTKKSKQLFLTGNYGQNFFSDVLEHYSNSPLFVPFSGASGSIVLQSTKLSNETQTLVNGQKFLSFSAPNLLSGNIAVSDPWNLTSFSAPVLKEGLVNLANSTSLTGTLLFPELERGSLSLGKTAISGLSLPKLFLGGISFTTAVADQPNLTSIDAPNLEVLISFDAPPKTGLSANFPKLKYMAANLSGLPSVMATINLPELVAARSILTQSFVTNTSITSFNFPKLQILEGGMSEIAASFSFPSLTSINFPELLCSGIPRQTLSGFSTSWTFGNNIGGGFTIGSAPVLTSINLPKIEFISGSIQSFSPQGSVVISGAPNLATFNINPTPKHFRSTFSITGAALDQASVDGILVALAYMDGTANAPYPAYSNKTVNLSGGTSATPSATGLAAKATLVARGCTVTHN